MFLHRKTQEWILKNYLLFSPLHMSSKEKEMDHVPSSKLVCEKRLNELQWT